MEKPLVDTLRSAPRPLLDEIIKESESRLSAQLSTALASDQRAMNFFGFMVAAVIVVTGASFAMIKVSYMLSAIAALAAIGLVVSAYFALQAAVPTDFEMVGNDPSSWVEDIESNISIDNALAEQASHYDEMLKNNRAAMAASAHYMRMAGWTAEVTVAIGALVAIFHWMALII